MTSKTKEVSIGDVTLEFGCFQKKNKKKKTAKLWQKAMLNQKKKSYDVSWDCGQEFKQYYISGSNKQDLVKAVTW